MSCVLAMAKMRNWRYRLGGSAFILLGKTNPKGAQLIFTTHDTELLNMELLRKDHLYFVDKHNDDGASELYSISTFSTRTTDNIRKGYLLGKYGAIPDIEIERLQD